MALFLAAFEGKWLVVSGCVQVDAGKPPIIAVTPPLPDLRAPDFSMKTAKGHSMATAA
jgi:hypothetical protein